jgi:hypothetical protein
MFPEALPPSGTEGKIHVDASGEAEAMVNVLKLFE